MSLENMGVGEQAPDQINRIPSKASMDLASEREEAINTRRTIEVMANEYEGVKNRIAQLDEQINKAVDAGLKNEGGMGEVHKNIGRQLSAEKEKEISRLPVLEKEMMDMKKATVIQLFKNPPSWRVFECRTMLIT
jgi:hypothetical protein